MTRIGGRSNPKASGPGARGPGPVESGLITYSDGALQVLGLALATPTRRAGAPSPTSFSSLPQGSRSGTPVAGQAPARAGFPGLTI